MLFNYKSIFCISILFICFISRLHAQDYFIYGEIKDSLNESPVIGAEIYNLDGQLLSTSNQSGYFKFYTPNSTLDVIVFTEAHNIYQNRITAEDSTFIDIWLVPLHITLNEIEIKEKRKDFFALKKLDDIVETSIYAGKKTEVVLLENNFAGLSLNNARQIYQQVVGLNIYQNDDAGLQLNIGGRGLDPNRTANFNTRQNGYDISADVLGYPESYYTPPAEALERIEIVRGAASLQYGTQFGGLINFILKSPSKTQKNKYIIRSTTGSNALFTNFFSIDRSYKEISCYSFINYKKGDGFRANSAFESKNGYIYLDKRINNKLLASFEFTSLEYLAKQAGGLNNQMFIDNPLQTNRSRNWFKINWRLYNIQLRYKHSKNTLHSINLFALDAERHALGYRSNRVAQEDPMGARDLIRGDFNNIGAEYKVLFKNKIKHLTTATLLGLKLYKSNNRSQQGAGSKNSDPDFRFYNQEFPSYKNQSLYKYPNLNIAVFGENIFYINNNFSITPGFRIEHIDTRSDGGYTNMLFDNANNLISDTVIYNTERNIRDFTILGLGISYKITNNIESYVNISENYRSVTFSDISIVSPAFVIDPEIKDEKGYTADIGFRGVLNTLISYDLNAFYLLYNDRIGFIQREQSDGNVKSIRGNIGDAQILGIESIIDLRLDNLLAKNMKSNFFINTAIINSQYIRSKENGIIGNTIEFVPNINLKTGFNISYKSLRSNLQFTYLAKQFTDATNAVESNLSGIIGEIPAYEILDLGISYTENKFTIEAGINNLLNKSYFTRRATGYPGPGIIPSPKKNYYITLELEI